MCHTKKSAPEKEKVREGRKGWWARTRQSCSDATRCASRNEERQTSSHFHAIVFATKLTSTSKNQRGDSTSFTWDLSVILKSETNFDQADRVSVKKAQSGKHRAPLSVLCQNPPSGCWLTKSQKVPCGTCSSTWCRVHAETRHVSGSGKLSFNCPTSKTRKTHSSCPLCLTVQRT